MPVNALRDLGERISKKVWYLEKYSLYGPTDTDYASSIVHDEPSKNI